MTLFLGGLSFLVLAVLISLMAPRAVRLSLFSALAISGLFLSGAAALTTMLGGRESLSLLFPFEQATLVLDPLSSFFVMVISLAGIAGILYGAGYLAHYRERSLRGHLAAWGVFFISMLLVVTCHSTVPFLFAWELMSLSSLILIFFERKTEEVREALITYFVAMHVAFACVLVGLFLFSGRSGSGEFSSFVAATADPSFSEAAILILFTGFAIKAGFVPFHSWLPQAHPAAPSHVSGIMSGIMIKTGIYGILRFLLIVGVPSTRSAIIVLSIAILSAVAGVLYALAQHDLKRLLAYHSVENIGIIGIGIGLAMLGIRSGKDSLCMLGLAGALLHVLNHAIFKGLLFYGAGAIYQSTGVRNIEKLGGIMGRMPLTAFLFIVGSIAIAGLPPLNGFISEFLLYLAMFFDAWAFSGIDGALVVITIGSLSLTGILALYCFTKACGVVLLGVPRSTAVEQAHDPGWPMIAGMMMLAIMIALIGLVPVPFLSLVESVVSQYPLSADTMAKMTETKTILWHVSRVSVLFVLLFGILYAVRHHLLKQYGISRGNTWGCGYRFPTARMQYTASSYASPLMVLIGRPIGLREHLIPPQGLFPSSVAFSSHSYDIVDTYLLAPMGKTIRYLFSLFRWVQSGDMAQYLLYGVLFLMLALVWVLGRI